MRILNGLGGSAGGFDTGLSRVLMNARPAKGPHSGP
jgi:hypothetical protein